MQKKAMGGDVNAAREYREWMKLNRQIGGRGINGDIISAVSEGGGKQGLDLLEVLMDDPSVVPFSTHTSSRTGQATPTRYPRTGLTGDTTSGRARQSSSPRPRKARLGAGAVAEVAAYVEP